MLLTTVQGFALPEDLELSQIDLTLESVAQALADRMTAGADPAKGFGLIVPARDYDLAYTVYHELANANPGLAVSILCVDDAHSGWSLRSLDWYTPGPTQGIASDLRMFSGLGAKADETGITVIDYGRDVSVTIPPEHVNEFLEFVKARVNQ